MKKKNKIMKVKFYINLEFFEFYFIAVLNDILCFVNGLVSH